MSCVLLVNNENITNPMGWFSNKMKLNSEWEKDENLAEYNNDSVYYSESNNYYRFEDMENELFTYWSIEDWISFAENNEILYGYYSEDDLSAEFIHIKDSNCIREFREFSDDESDNVNNGELPQFESWVDVATYVDEEMN